MFEGMFTLTYSDAERDFRLKRNLFMSKLLLSLHELQVEFHCLSEDAQLGLLVIYFINGCPHNSSYTNTCVWQKRREDE